MRSCFTVDEVEELAEVMVRQYLGKQREPPLRVDMDGFLTGYLCLPLEYHSFAEDDLGKIGFISDGATPLLILLDRQTVQRVFPKGTVVLEKSLQSENEEGRRRFTLAHEASHYIMDKTVASASFRREQDKGGAYGPQELRELLSVQEAKVDRLAAALLMPAYIVRNVIGQFAGTEAISLYGDNILRLEDKLLVQKMAGVMGVSYTAFLIRLKELRLVERREVSEYITQEIGLGNGGMRQ